MDRAASEIQKLLDTDPATCCVCHFVMTGIRGHIDKLFHERVLDIPTREAIRKTT